MINCAYHHYFMDLYFLKRYINQPTSALNQHFAMIRLNDAKWYEYLHENWHFHTFQLFPVEYMYCLSGGNGDFAAVSHT